MKKRKTIRAQRENQRTRQTRSKSDERLPFLEHLYELRRRLFKVALSVLVFGGLGYSIQQQLVRVLLKPSHGQSFIYTSPLGGLNFLFQICIYFGLVLSIPVIVYQMLRYLEPLIREETKTLVIRYSIVSGLLAAAGGSFGYFFGLPVALRFLSHQFTTSQIHPLLTIQEYMSFVTIYLFGSALLFQIPLIITFINRIKPLRPIKLLGFERYMVLISFVAAAIMTPTTDIFDQLIFAVPIMFMYQVGIVMVYLKNRRHHRRRSKRVQQLLEQDAVTQEARLREGREYWAAKQQAQASTVRPPVRPPSMSRPVPRPSLTPVSRLAPRPASVVHALPQASQRRSRAWDVIDPYLQPSPN